MNDMSPVTERVRVRRPRVFLRLFLILLLVGVVGGALIGFHIFKANILKQVVKQITSTLPTVATTKAVTQPWQKHLVATGTLRASRGADLAAEVAGIVDDLHIDSGTDVPAGTVLLRLRPNDDDAKLAQLQAVADLDSITLQRDQRQLKAQGVAQSTVDTDEGNLRAARAQVEAQQRLMAEKIVRAPFAGRLGIRQVDVGQYLAAGTTIVTLQALDPIFVDFFLPQQALGDVRIGQAATVRVDSYPGRDFPGTVTAINAKVDSASRMVQVRATLKNADEVLLPGMYATISIDAGAPTQLVTIPQTAVSYNPYGSLVYIVHQDGTDAAGHPKLMVSQTFVTVADTRGDQAAIAKGVAAGDTVVTAGQLKLRNNIQVLVDNAVTMPDAPNPQPADQ
jgi:membrane fusion protein (multidrug efflux system)